MGNGQPWEPALCQLYRHTFVPYTGANVRSLTAACRAYTRSAVGMGITIGIPMGMGMGWVWG